MGIVVIFFIFPRAVSANITGIEEKIDLLESAGLRPIVFSVEG